MTELERGKYVYGIVKVGERGQIVIPQDAREAFDIKPGDRLIVFGEKDKGIFIADVHKMKQMALRLIEDFKTLDERFLRQEPEE